MINKKIFKKFILKLLLVVAVSILYTFVTFADTDSSDNDDMYTEKIESLNDGYFYKLKFKKKFNSEGYFYGRYEDLYVTEFLVENEDPDKKPFTIKASWLGWEDFKCQYNSTGGSIFYIIDLNNIRYIRVYKKTDDGHNYDLYSENGKRIDSMLNVCEYIGEDKEYIIIQDSIKTEIYDLDFQVVKTFIKTYNLWKILKSNNPDKDLIYLGKKDDNWNFESGGVLLDKKMNLVYENLSFEAHVITDKVINLPPLNGVTINWKEVFNSYREISYRHILLSKSVNDIKYKNGDSVGETFIIDSDLNKVFSTHNKLISETEYYIDGKHTILLIFDNIYYLLDENMSVIETGDPNDKAFKDKKEINDFNSKTRYEFTFN